MMFASTSTINVIMASLFLPLSCLASPFYIPPASVTSEVSSTASEVPLYNINPDAAVAAAAQTPACTTLRRFNGFKYGPTSTVYASTATQTVSVDCGTGCSSLAVFNFGGHGPIAVFETTITRTDVATTTTEFVCGATATGIVESDSTSTAAAAPTTSSEKTAVDAESSASESSDADAASATTTSSGSLLGLALDIAVGLDEEEAS